MQKQIIALTGAKGVGKTSIATEIESRDWPDRCILSFADPLRRMLAQLIPMPLMTDPTQKEQPLEWMGGKSPRQLLQSLGTDWGRDMVSETIWIDAMRRMIADQTFGTIIIDDCRFENEAQMVRDMGGIVIGLEREGVNYTGEHVSENPIKADAIIDATFIDCAADAIDQIIERGY
ncbi:putative deoxynucleotide monophosphate kinase [Verrucomicrobia phage P8625]|uniref:putative deoxynucleotide monophosphate kinase n=1 Tax=Verrucomicrobia phage P8625 TaxID=1636271 RepID=UPI0005FEB5DA|nr:putative deoxynucleotide monophosphate kinase [Verrucomicrobia phage P8625]AKA60281.1 putative deoxynucleotide monophosphate kinase [Verrucomicrobia phage P8625]